MVHTKEIWDASGYDQANGQQFRDAEETIQAILADHSEEVDIIVDIGCGSGNVTKLVSSRVPHKRMYAVDFDAQMVAYADETYNDGTIEYFVQNMEVPWEELDERLRNLEGKVDIVWSNRVLHWVKNKKNAVSTIGRLMKKNGGRCYVNTTLLRDLNEFATEEEREENKKYINQDTHKGQSDIWKECFSNAGLTKFDITTFEKKWVYDSEAQFDSVEQPAAPLLVKKFILRGDISEEEKEAAMKKYTAQFLKSFGAKFGTNYLAKDYKHDGLSVYYEQFRIIGVKE